LIPKSWPIFRTPDIAPRIFAIIQNTSYRLIKGQQYLKKKCGILIGKKLAKKLFFEARVEIKEKSLKKKFVGFLVDLKTPKCPFEINWPLGPDKMETSLVGPALIVMLYSIDMLYLLGVMFGHYFSQCRLFCLIKPQCQVWQYGLWSFQGRTTKLDRFLAKKQLSIALV
jgi:hypothetical protein